MATGGTIGLRNPKLRAHNFLGGVAKAGAYAMDFLTGGEITKKADKKVKAAVLTDSIALDISRFAKVPDVRVKPGLEAAKPSAGGKGPKHLVLTVVKETDVLEQPK